MLPLQLLYVFSWCLSFPLRAFYRRKLVINNLKKVFPAKNENQIKILADRFYRNFSDVVVEVLKASSISEKEIAKRIQFKNPEIAFEQQRKQQALLFYASHQCNWEWMALASGIHLTVPGDVIYQPLENEKVDKFIFNMRSRFGGQPIAKDNGARKILKLKNQHKIIGLASDQSPPRDHVHWSYVFGIETDFYPGLVQLPYLMQAPAVFGKMVRIRQGYYEVELVKIGEPPYEKGDYSVLKNYIKEMEKLVEGSPEDYLWTHNRWKHTREENEEIINVSS